MRSRRGLGSLIYKGAWAGGKRLALCMPPVLVNVAGRQAIVGLKSNTTARDFGRTMTRSPIQALTPETLIFHQSVDVTKDFRYFSGVVGII